MADDIKSVIARVVKLEQDLNKVKEELKGVHTTLLNRATQGGQMGNMELQITRLQGDAVKLENRVKAL